MERKRVSRTYCSYSPQQAIFGCAGYGPIQLAGRTVQVFGPNYTTRIQFVLRVKMFDCGLRHDPKPTYASVTRQLFWLVAQDTSSGTASGKTSGSSQILQELLKRFKELFQTI